MKIFFSRSAFLLTIVVFPFMSFAQDGVIRPRRQTEIPGNRPIDAMNDRRSMEQVSVLLTKAYKEIEKALPVYSGRAHQAKYLTQFASEDLNRSLQYQKPEVSGARAPRNMSSDLRARIEKIPPVKDKNKRDYSRDLVKMSDAKLKTGGNYLAQARNKLSRIRDTFGGHLDDSRRLIDMAISEVDRAVGRFGSVGRIIEIGRNRIPIDIGGN